MSIAWQKRACWLVFILSSGALLSALVDHFMSVVPRPPLLFWLCIPVSIVSYIRLRNCYRIEPLPYGGRWQLRLEDLLVCTLYTGMMLGLCRSLFDLNFAEVGIPYAFIHGIGLLVGMLVTARRGETRGFNRVLSSLVFGLNLIGTMSAASMIATAIMDSAEGFNYLAWANMVFFRPDLRRWDVDLQRLTLLCLPIGAASWILARALRGKATTSSSISPNRS